jgi:hypothetical protein
VVTPGAYPRRKHLKGAPILGWLWPCPQILRPDWKGFPSTNPSSLLCLLVSDEGKKFYNIDHRIIREKLRLEFLGTQPFSIKPEMLFEGQEMVL